MSVEAPDGWEISDGKLRRELTFADFVSAPTPAALARVIAGAPR